MAKRKSSSTRTPAAPAHRNEAPAPSRDISDAATKAFEAATSCSLILAFLTEFHLRDPHSEMMDDIDAGEARVLDYVRDLLGEANTFLEWLSTRPAAGVAHD